MYIFVFLVYQHPFGPTVNHYRYQPIRPLLTKAQGGLLGVGDGGEELGTELFFLQKSLRFWQNGSASTFRRVDLFMNV
jgi:hypothetical protein